jgi:hypothetical protein
MDTLNKRMTIMFTGWVECNTDETTFQYIGPMAAHRAVISGTKFMSLSEHEQDNYILEDLGQAITYSVDGEFNELNIDIEDC